MLGSRGLILPCGLCSIPIELDAEDTMATHPETHFTCDHCGQAARFKITAHDIPEDGRQPTDERDYGYACIECAVVHGHVILIKADGVYSTTELSWFETAEGRFVVGDTVQVSRIALSPSDPLATLIHGIGTLGGRRARITKIQALASGAVHVTIWPLDEHKNAYAVISSRFIRKDA